MFTHQVHNSIGEDIYNAYVYKNFSFGLHWHKGCEFLYVQEGELQATISDKQYVIKQENWLFLPPYTVHGYHSLKDNQCFIVVFSGEEIQKRCYFCYFYG